MDTERDKDREMLTRAATLRAPLARAGRLAASNGMGYLVFGALTVLLSLSTDAADLVAIAVGVTLLYVGSAARRLGPRLADGDAAAARALARNELVLLAAISIYCLLMATVVRATSAELDDTLKSVGYNFDMAGLARATYAVMFVVTLLYQGGLARHFRRQVPRAEEYVAEIPEWARETVATLPS
ncbi:MAG TPA: hypothetical protein VFY71_15875 [Planctomycetota bacterium]|nr:hypothetical protein [Planctomycetota bacterium]